MSIVNLKERLDKLMEKVKNISEISKKTPYTEEVLLYIKWRQIAEVVGNLVKIPKITPEIVNYTKKLKKKYKFIAPKRTEYKQDLKNIEITKVLEYFKEGIFVAINLAEKNLKILPMKSYEIYEDAYEFISLFEGVLKNSLIESARKLVKKKIFVLKKAFEVEAGRKNLEEEQKSLTKNLQNRLDGVKDTSDSSVEVAPDIDASDIESKDTDVTLAGLILPEEDIEEEYKKPEPIEIPENNALIQDSKVLSTPIEAIDVDLYQNVISEPKTAYPYWMWYPSQNLQYFVGIRYCIKCGRKTTNTNKCSNCGFITIK